MIIQDWPYVLRAGHSDDPSDGACAMDAINWIAHGKHGDQPICACPIIGMFVTVGNDSMPDGIRQGLIPFLHRIAGSKSPADEGRRLRILQLAALRVFAADALSSAALHTEAATLANLPDDVDIAACAAIARAAEAKATRARAFYAARASYVASTAYATLDFATKASCAASAAAHAGDAAIYAADAVSAVADATNVAACVAAAAVRAAAARNAGAFDNPWSDYFRVLDEVLAAGPQGEPWSADVVTMGSQNFTAAGGVASVGVDT